MCFETEYTQGKTTAELIHLNTILHEPGTIPSIDGEYVFEEYLKAYRDILEDRLEASKFIRELVIKCGALSKEKGILFTSVLYSAKVIAEELNMLGIFDRKGIVLFLEKQLHNKIIV